ncbi:MAG: carboxypeptidase-like regulatory domain-containing protein [Bacteroidales bacterium]|nr:carboxypeptidase-like regulatory domain-containing protein [Bacteroidales bacterium]
MLRNLLLTIGIVLATSLVVFPQTSGTLQGKVIDKDTQEELPFVNIVLEVGGFQESGASSDINGKYVIKPIPPGKYDIRATFIGYNEVLIRGVQINANQTRFFDIEMTSAAIGLPEIEIIDYKIPLIDKDKTVSGGTVTQEEIQKMPNRSVGAIAATIGGVFSRDGEAGNIRGARTGDTRYYIDGMPVIGSLSLPQSAIAQQSVILGGLPAQYGDATGGVVEVTTRGPSRIFGAGIELETSEFLDPFGYNRVGLNLNGPIFRKKAKESGKKGESLLGYFIGGDFTYHQDGRPFAGDMYRATDEYISYLQQNPLRVSGLESGGTFVNGEYTRASDLEKIKTTSNTSRYNINLSGKIDVRTGPTVNLTFGGQYNYNRGNGFNYNSSMFNYDKNSLYYSQTWRVFGRFTQRFPNDPHKNSLIKNVYYSIQADYQKYSRSTHDPDHKNDVFKYGHIGSFTSHLTKNYTLGSDTIGGQYYEDVYIMDNYFDTLYTFTPGNLNPYVTKFTSEYYSLYPDPAGNWRNADQVQLGGGLLNGQGPPNVYGMWALPGANQVGYSEFNNSQISVNATGSMDIGNHELKFGIQYEQRQDRSYSVGPTGLWTLMSGLTNFHIQELDVDNPEFVYRDGVFQDTVEYKRRYDAASQRVFDMNLRKKLGLSVTGTDFINIQSYDYNTNSIQYFDENNVSHTISVGEELFDLGMFSPDELLNDGNWYVTAIGYDYTGDKLTSKPSFSDFFNQTDDEGNYTRSVGAFEPIYMAGFIQDKFAFKDLIFNIGVRVDRFDANQMVLKDPFLLYPAKSVNEVQNVGGQAVEHPSNMGSNYIVYVDNVDNPSRITGYRDESTWYNAEGTEIQDPNILNVGSGISPYLVDKSLTRPPMESFADYDPQINVMPRISFSFPISDVALFFAHYDVLTQRPTSNLRSDPRVYYFFDNIGGVINNPNLKPSKTIDYELGFQQKLSPTSSLKFVAFYREMRDMIQIYRFNGAYPKDYTSFNNIDFGTVKGMTIQYDLRRTNNARISAYYTLQFANGTGSSTTTAAALVASGLPNLRTTFPLAWDRRHSFNIFFDYRFGRGADYNGPSIKREKKGKAPLQLLNNSGLSMTLTGGSGTPYTRSRNIYSQISGGTRLLQGTYYGSRLPWQFRMDVRIDKDIPLTMGKGDNPRKGNLNIYFSINNVLNTKNVMGVYPATGNPDDDGYLAAPEWQREINEQLDSQSFRDLYSILVNYPGNYSAPRTIRFGVIFNF